MPRKAKNMIQQEIIERLRVPPGKRLKLKDHDPGWAQTPELKEAGKQAVKQRALEVLEKNLAALTTAQELLWAGDTYSLLVVLQAMDAAGKDGIIKHVMSGLNPQGCQVYSFKKPSDEELDHDFLWRCAKRVPRARPHRHLQSLVLRGSARRQGTPRVARSPEAAARQARQAVSGRSGTTDINTFEHHLVRNGTVILKFFLHISRTSRKSDSSNDSIILEKHWKFSATDMAERDYWDEYMRAFEDALSATSTKWAPWYVIPANHKWAARALVADILTTTIQSLGLKYPKVDQQQRKALVEAKAKLESEE